jgi:hypothetical protein
MPEISVRKLGFQVLDKWEHPDFVSLFIFCSTGVSPVPKKSSQGQARCLSYKRWVYKNGMLRNKLPVWCGSILSEANCAAKGKPV